MSQITMGNARVITVQMSQITMGNTYESNYYG